MFSERKESLCVHFAWNSSDHAETHQNKKSVTCRNCGVFIAHEHAEQHGIQYENDKPVKVVELKVGGFYKVRS